MERLQTVSLAVEQRPRMSKKRESLIKTLLTTPLLARRRAAQEQPINNDTELEEDEDLYEIDHFRLFEDDSSPLSVGSNSTSTPLSMSSGSGSGIGTPRLTPRERRSKTSTDSDVTYIKMTAIPSPDTEELVSLVEQAAGGGAKEEGEKQRSRRSSSIFSSPFRKGVKKPSSGGESVEGSWQDRQLSREEAWQLYLMKMEEESNYLRVEEEQDEICSCPQCIASYEALYSEYLSREAKKGSSSASLPSTSYDQLYDPCTTVIMQSIMEHEEKICVIM